MRHDSTMGLMVAKQTGGDAALGEFLGFFDCHVAPNVGWYKEAAHSVGQGGVRGAEGPPRRREHATARPLRRRCKLVLATRFADFAVL